MDLINILILVSAVATIAVLWVIIGYLHLRRLWREVGDHFELIDVNMRKRQDLVPNLVETVRRFGADTKEMGRLIAVRGEAAKKYGPNAKKIELEHDLSMSLNKLMEWARGCECKKDTNFLELQKEISDLEVAMGKKTEEYNVAVRLYNKRKNLLILKFLSSIFGFNRANIFDVEA